MREIKEKIEKCSSDKEFRKSDKNRFVISRSGVRFTSSAPVKLRVFGDTVKS